MLKLWFKIQGCGWFWMWWQYNYNTYEMCVWLISNSGLHVSVITVIYLLLRLAYISGALLNKSTRTVVYIETWRHATPDRSPAREHLTTTMDQLGKVTHLQSLAVFVCDRLLQFETILTLHHMTYWGICTISPHRYTEVKLPLTPWSSHLTHGPHHIAEFERPAL